MTETIECGCAWDEHPGLPCPYPDWPVRVHGKRSTYINKGCRCPDCKAANTQHMRDYRANLKRKEATK
jgi:hypothetical protein